MRILTGKKIAPLGAMFIVTIKSRKAIVRIADASDKTICSSKLLGYYENIDYLSVEDSLHVGTIHEGTIWHVKSIGVLGGRHRGLKLWRKETGLYQELEMEINDF